MTVLWEPPGDEPTPLELFVQRLQGVGEALRVVREVAVPMKDCQCNLGAEHKCKDFWDCDRGRPLMLGNMAYSAILSMFGDLPKDTHDYLQELAKLGDELQDNAIQRHKRLRHNGEALDCPAKSLGFAVERIDMKMSSWVGRVWWPLVRRAFAHAKIADDADDALRCGLAFVDGEGRIVANSARDDGEAGDA